MNILQNKEYIRLSSEKTTLISEAQGLIALKEIENGKRKYISASKLEMEIAKKFPRLEFIHLLSSFWCVYAGSNLELCKDSYKLLERIDKTTLNKTQEKEIIKIKNNLEKMVDDNVRKIE